jgi:hypothetical protein
MQPCLYNEAGKEKNILIHVSKAVCSMITLIVFMIFLSPSRLRYTKWSKDCNNSLATHETATHMRLIERRLNNSGLQIVDCIINPELEFQIINYIILVSRCRMQLCTGGKLTTRAFTLYCLQYWFVNCNVQLVLFGSCWQIRRNLQWTEPINDQSEPRNTLGE